MYGAAKTFTSVPPGYTLETVLVATTATEPASSDPDRASIPRGGVNAALFSYGDYVLARHKKVRARGSHNTETAFLGYSTTGFYFYNLCDCTDVPAPTAKCVAPCPCATCSGVTVRSGLKQIVHLSTHPPAHLPTHSPFQVCRSARQSQPTNMQQGSQPHTSQVPAAGRHPGGMRQLRRHAHRGERRVGR